MKRLNFDIKDRKILYGILIIVLVCVFTLTIAYAALNAVLTISGNAQVSSADWNIYLANPKVTSGSATTDVPLIRTSNTLEFSTTLNMPGDFYEFIVDVVNDGSIDAMIENVVKNPELDSNQKKYLNYTVTYQNGESIGLNQLLAKNTTMPIKVRIEYRNDISASDLPTGQVVLDLSLTLEYIQSDGSGTSVPNNGVGGDTGEVEDPYSIEAYGSLDDIGTIVKIGTEKFYTIGTDGDNVKLLAMYNLHVGNYVDEEWNVIPLVNPTGMQNSIAKGSVYDPNSGDELLPFVGTTRFSSPEQQGTSDSDYNGSIVELYVNNYKGELETRFAVDVVEARSLTLNEAIDSNTFKCQWASACSSEYPWIMSTSYWLMTQAGSLVYYIEADNYLDYRVPSGDDACGVRPVIVVPKNTFN